VDGYSHQSRFLNKAALLEADLGGIKAVILNHGHPDNFLGLVELLKLIGKERDKGVSLDLHPDVFLERRTNNPSIGPPVTMPSLDEGILIEAGVFPIKSKRTLQIANSFIHTT
jgi:7,8-dihydropterin-6-yl-methyl-4-(beta-D-ribofuranosyl)aminobenzene 5'-phosphate synthase